MHQFESLLSRQLSFERFSVYFAAAGAAPQDRLEAPVKHQPSVKQDFDGCVDSAKHSAENRLSLKEGIADG